MKYKKIIFLIIAITICNSLLIAQEPTVSQSKGEESGAFQSKEKVQIIDPNTMTNLTDFGSIWEITKLAGGLRWVIILVLVVGLASILYKYAELFIDSRRATQINQCNLLTVSISELENVVLNSPNNWLYQLFNNMLKIFRTTERAEDFHYEITNFVQCQQDQFSTFQGRMAFLSDTAGALGLLGTVWGMFVTFSRGVLDNQVILTGMGIALVTTLMGLVVSIILNLFYTQIAGYFGKKIDAIQVKGEELRLLLLKLQKSRHYTEYRIDRRAKKPADKNDQKEDIQPVEFEKEQSIFDLDFNVNDIENDNSKCQILSISGDNQLAQVNSRLKQPFMAQVTNGDGKGAGGQWVIFSVENGSGTLANGGKIDEVITDGSGIAKSFLILGNTVGENIVKASLKRGNGEYIQFKAVGHPAPPTQLKYISGNLQNSPAGQELKEPFIVKLIDNYNNPITDYPVIFKVKIGKGYFPGNKRTYVTRTDSKGIAQTYFILRPEPGFNSINAYAKGLKRSKIEFEALGQ